MHAASETSRQIVEFEELVSRLDRINNCSSEPDLGSAQIESRLLPSSTTSALLSLPLSSSSSFSRRHHQPEFTSLDNVTRASRSENFLSDNQQQQEKSVRVHIGIDDDLRMILEMDPSIVDRAPTPLVPPSSTTTTFARAPRATRPQGWYWIARD